MFPFRKSIAAAIALLFPVVCLPAHAATGIDWQPTTATAGLECSAQDMAYGKGLFMAACYDESTTTPAAVSAYLSEWKAASSGITGITGFTGIAFGGDRFVGVGPDGKAGYTTDGLNWTLVDIPPDVNSVRYGNGIFVAVGRGEVLTSPDGAAWTIRSGPSSGIPAEVYFFKVAYGAGTWVAIAPLDEQGTEVGVVMSSSDNGVTWERRTPAISGLLFDIIYAKDKFIVSCTDQCPATQKVMTSPDGVTWTARTTPEGTWTGLAYGFGFGTNQATSSTGELVVAARNYVGAGATDNVMTSPDGITWTLRSSGIDGGWTASAFGNGAFSMLSSESYNVIPISGMISYSVCGDGIPYTKPTGTDERWMQYATPCSPPEPSTVQSTMGTSFNAATYAQDWIVYGRNATNSGNTSLSVTAGMASSAGYWLGGKGWLPADRPTDGKVFVSGGSPASFTEGGPTGCQSFAGCREVAVNSTTAGTKMLGNPFVMDTSWSDVRIRVNGTVYSPTEAKTAGFVDNQIWIWNGSSYETWNDTSNSGNLRYSQAFFIKVLPLGVGQTIDVLVPVSSSGSTNPPPLGSVALLPAQSLSVSAAAAPRNWAVTLRATSEAKNLRATAVLGQYRGSADRYDNNDLAALAPFAAPWLTVVVPRTTWKTKKGDYSGDFRAPSGAKGSWPLEVRSSQAGAKVVIRWEGDKSILVRSRLKDNVTGAIINPTDPRYANGYSFTMTSTVRRMTWSYLGDAEPPKRK